MRRTFVWACFCTTVVICIAFVVAFLTPHMPIVSAEPVDVVLLEGWMLGFNPLPAVPLPVYVNLSDPTATEMAQQSAQPSALQQTTQQLSAQQTRQHTTHQPAQQHTTQLQSAQQTAGTAQQAHTVEPDGHTAIVLSAEQLAAEEARRAEFEGLYNKANNIKVRARSACAAHCRRVILLICAVLCCGRILRCRQQNCS
jgi:hypothetical protein